MQSHPPHDLIYQKQLHISWKRPDASNKLVILNLQDGDFFSLEDPVSIGIWEGLMKGQTPAAIIEGLQQTYPEADGAVVHRDADAFVADLLVNRLICPAQGVATHP